jgi:hypothetical protein
MLFEPKDDLWGRLRQASAHKGEKPIEFKLWMCGESEVCKCSYCVEVTVSSGA